MHHDALPTQIQVLPFRASISHHDAHHKYSNHAGLARNYGETFWVWDALFGTCSNVRGVAAATAAARAAAKQA
jgi:sterol desaturase/sphingolipid hydroxylase (fatty acid hydroxylase superfamily)